MPLVFVHGVATRQTPDYQARVRQRDALFRNLVLTEGAAIFDPDWGSGAVKFNPALPWVPAPGGAEPLGAGDVGQTGVARLANHDPILAVDVAFQVGLAARAQEAAAAAQPDDAISDEEIAAFVTAVRYLERAPADIDRNVFDPESSDSAFLETLAGELQKHTPADPGHAGAEPMGLANSLGWLKDGLRRLVDPLANAGSDAVLHLIRRPFSEQAALFLGDIFVYLRWRETDGAAGTANRIFKPIATDLTAAARVRSAIDPLIVVAHSLGGVVLYDLFSDHKQIAAIEEQIGTAFVVDALVTVGSQPGLFADMGLYSTPAAGEDGKYPCPPPVKKWLNIYDYTDVLSFRCSPFFENVEDFEFDNVASLLSAHSAYFMRPSFYSRLRSRLGN